jgi:hypothetical protein
MNMQYLEQDEATKRINKGIDTLQWLLERMRRRAAGRDRMKAAERKRRIKAAKLAGGVVSPRYLALGETEVEGDKPFYYKNGVLYRDGLGNHALEVIGRIEQQADKRRHGWL